MDHITALNIIIRSIKDKHIKATRAPGVGGKPKVTRVEFMNTEIVDNGHTRYICQHTGVPPYDTDSTTILVTCQTRLGQGSGYDVPQQYYFNAGQIPDEYVWKVKEHPSEPNQPVLFTKG